MFRFPVKLIGVACLALVTLETSALATPLQACDELIVEFERAKVDWRTRYRAAEGPKERSALRKQKPAADFHDRFTRLAGAGEGCAYLWLIENVDDGPTPISERVSRKIALYEELFVPAHSAASVMDGVDLLFKDAHLRRKVGFQTFERLTRQALDAAGGEHGAGIELQLALAVTRSKSEDEIARGIGLLNEWLARYPDAKDARRVRDQVFMLEHLRVGATAPDFTGNTIDAETIQLSDYRGKVVVLDFFGFW
jgi:hypothetical protein